jgi:lysophospholipase L1-like esterase
VAGFKKDYQPFFVSSYGMAVIKKQPFWPEMQKANAMIKMHAEKNPFVRYIDIVSLMLDEEGKLNPEWFIADGGHLSEKGYSGWSNKLRPILNSIPQTK